MGLLESIEGNFSILLFFSCHHSNIQTNDIIFASSLLNLKYSVMKPMKYIVHTNTIYFSISLVRKNLSESIGENAICILSYFGQCWLGKTMSVMHSLYHSINFTIKLTFFFHICCLALFLEEKNYLAKKFLLAGKSCRGFANASSVSVPHFVGI